MFLFVVSVAVVLLVSFLCSLTEASLYAVRMPYIRQLVEQGDRAGKMLHAMKLNMEQPISAVLIINTVANTAGAAVAGAEAVAIWGDSPWALAIFSLTFTLAVLFFSEITPKIIGVAFNRQIAPFTVVPLRFAIVAMYPVIVTVQRLSQKLMPKEQEFSASEEEVQQMASMSAEEGSILPMEAALVRNVLKLDDVRARDIMTPRSVVFKLPADTKLRDVSQLVKKWTHSRIPLYAVDDPETWIGLVLSRDILTRLANDEFDVTLETISKPLFFVSVKTPGHVLLKTFLRRRSHLFGVVDEFGVMAGVVSLEDVMEALLGEEIVDEADQVVDMQDLARMRRRQAFEQADATSEAD